MEDRDCCRREDHHRDGQSEVELHETHTVDVGLAGGRDESDGARLGRHDRESHGIPGHGLAGEQILVYGVRAAALVQAVKDDEQKRAGQDAPIEGPHSQALVNT